MRIPVLALALLLATAAAPLAAPDAAPAPDLFDRMADDEPIPYRVEGEGFVTDSGHPMHPGDQTRVAILVRLFVDPWLGEAKLEVESGEGDEKSIDRYFFRRGRVFQIDEQDEKKPEVAPEPLGDLSAAVVAAIHPALVAAAIRERRDNLTSAGGDSLLFAWNESLWGVRLDPWSGRIARLARRTWNDVRGDGVEEILYEDWPPEAGAPLSGRVTVRSDERETLSIEFTRIERGVSFDVPAGDRRRDAARVVGPNEIELVEVAPHVYTIDLASMSTRVTVAEFADHVIVLEGAYNDRNCDRIAAQIRRTLDKPVRYFAFSHLHGQYLGGTRSWVHAGATVLVPPTTAPLIEEVVADPHSLRPDALARDPKPARVETIADRRRFEDGTNALEIFNIVSGHTDEYFLFYFPKQKLAMTGDLLFYRPGKPLTGRSKTLCDTIAKLGLDVERYYATWPLDGYGTKSVVTREEMAAGCAAGQ